VHGDGLPPISLARSAHLPARSRGGFASAKAGRRTGRFIRATAESYKLHHDVPRRSPLRVQPLVEVLVHRHHQILDLAVEEMVGADDHLLVDHDALLGLELVDQAGDILVRHHRVLVAVHDQAGRRAGGEERQFTESDRSLTDCLRFCIENSSNGGVALH